MSLQDIIKRRQRADFVGRDERLTEFGANLRLPPGDLDRKFLFNIHGVAGVGKTFLTEQFRRVAERAGVVCAYADEASFDVLETLTALAADLAGQDRALAAFDKRLATYRERRHELEADPGAPGGGFITRSAVRVGLAATRGVPLLSMAADTVDPAAAAEQVDRLRAYLSKKFRSSEDVRLLLAPAEVLTKVFLADLDKLAERHPVALFFDTFEQTGSYLEGWLLDVLAGRHGRVGANVVLTVAGQRPLDANRWAPYRGVTADVSLEPFTEAEARELLAAKGVHDEETIQGILALSGRLPVWLATLADHRPATRADVVDSSDSAVERFLKWEPDEDRREVALAGALPRRLNEDILAVIDRSGLFGWLRKLPFVTETAGHWRYHEVARAPMLRLYRNRSPQRWREQHRRLAEHYIAEVEALGLTDQSEWSNPTFQDLVPEICYHRLCADPDAELPTALGYALTALNESATMARRWAAAMAAAGQDSGAESVLTRGERLGADVPDDDNDGVAFLTALITDPALLPDELKYAYYQRGTAHRKGKRYPQALDDYRAALRLDPDYSQALAERGDTYRTIGDFEAALADLGRAIELDPAFEWALVSRSETWLALDRYQEVIDDLTRVLELAPDHAWATSVRGLMYGQIGRNEDALADLDRAIELDPSDEVAYANRGMAYHVLKRFDEALSDFDRAIEHDPDDSSIIAQRGSLYHDLGRHSEALTDLDRAVELNPADSWALATRGIVRRHLGRHDEALADLDEAVRLTLNDGSTLCERALAYRMLERYEDALVDLDRVIELNPTHRWALINRGEVSFLLGRHDDALTDFAAVIDLDPRDDWANSSRGRTYLALGRLADAIASLTTAIDTTPSFLQAITLRCRAYLRAGRFTEALADVERAVAVGPPSSWHVYLRGAVRLANGESDRAVDDLRAAADLGRAEMAAEPALPVFRFNLAIYLAALGEWTEAAELLRATNHTRLGVVDFLEDLVDLAGLPGVDPERVAELASVVAGEAQVHPSV
jgi:tetratricopeptide (TPR) repeat protein